MGCTACEEELKVPGQWILVDKEGNCSRCGRPVGLARGKELMPSLDEANSLVNGERQDDYGRPEDSFNLIADYWSTYIQASNSDLELKEVFIHLTARDVAAMMILLKVARGVKKRDNWIDIAGYAAIAADRLED